MIRQGEILNNTYQIIDELGSGGGGIIYRARHLRLNIDVVVKQVKDEAKGILSVISEADVLKRLHHTYLPRVYDFLEIDGEIYTVMDFIAGTDLRHAVQKNGYFPQKTVLRWAKQLAEALSYLHSLNPPVIHGDIKPANIMLQPSGDICLIDFNVSLVFDNSKRKLTSISEGFSPPEQYRSKNMYDQLSGKTRPQTSSGSTDSSVFKTENMDEETSQILNRTIGLGIDERSDIYSLGSTLYYLLTGIRPSSHYWENPAISDYDIELSEGFSFIISKMMSLDPAERYQSGVELKEAFLHIYDLDSEYRKFHKKNKLRAVLSAGMLFVGVGLCTGGWLTMQRETDNAYALEILDVEKALDEEDIDKAEEMISRAMKTRPNRIEAYVSETRRLYLLEDYDEVIEYGTAMINSPVYDLKTEEDQRSTGDILLLIGNAYYENEAYADAADAFRSAIKRNDENGDYFRDYAAALAQEGNLEEANKCLDMAKKLGLGKDSIYLIEAEISYIEKNYEEAVEQFQNAIQFTKDRTIERRASAFISDCYKNSGDIQGQIQFLEQYVTRPDASKSSFTYLGTAYFQNGQYDKAAEMFRKSIAAGDTQIETQLNLASCYEQLGQLNEAARILLEAANVYPDRYELYRNLAFLEGKKQMGLSNDFRDYHTMQNYYNKAQELYQKSAVKDDQQMIQLDNMIQQAKSGGWL